MDTIIDNIKIVEALISFGIIRIKNENEKRLKNIIPPEFIINLKSLIDNQLEKFDLINIDFKIFSSKSFYYLIHRGNVDLIECLLENDNYLYANNFYTKIDKDFTECFKILRHHSKCLEYIDDYQFEISPQTKKRFESFYSAQLFKMMYFLFKMIHSFLQSIHLIVVMT
ncbi:hypothetical protein BpHYR1_053791 [Brachionus plicatilis]|uniref:Uncharacterized protein n=1 Tax=Brachionus plicatilis TaxID=10195 RepID=A0A3M7TAT4_BRAPC|nr:hypothetical protein BpHYR1_053791 [Brachionus plicatilis]